MIPILVEGQTIKLLSYNTHMIFTAECKNSRAVKINNFLLKCGADIVLLQEVYSKKIMKKISRGFPYIITDFPNNKKHFHLVKSGLVVLSKYPLMNVSFHEFENSKGIDSYSDKGVLMFDALITISLNDSTTEADYKIIKIANTHLQNNFHPITIAQIQEVKAFTQKADVVGGDFNYEDFQYLADQFNKEVTITGDTYKKQTIDYIFTKKPVLVHTTYKNESTLSDHLPIECLINVGNY